MVIRLNQNDFVKVCLFSEIKESSSPMNSNKSEASHPMLKEKPNEDLEGNTLKKLTQIY